MKDIVQGLNAAKTEAAINGVKIELQGLILDAQQGLFAAQEAQSTDARRIAELEQEVMRLKDWSADRERYELQNFRGGSVVYSQKVSIDNRQAPHWLCASCFDHGEKSYLQKQGEIGPDRIYGCGICKSKVNIDRMQSPA
jgi:hypothetical protein